MNGQVVRKEAMGVNDKREASFEEQGKWKRKNIVK
jgi:hypothetical protein